MSCGVSLVPSNQLRWVNDLSVKSSIAVFISFCVLGWVSGMNLLLWASKHRAFLERGLVVCSVDMLCTFSSWIPCNSMWWYRSIWVDGVGLVLK